MREASEDVCLRARREKVNLELCCRIGNDEKADKRLCGLTLAVMRTKSHVSATSTHRYKDTYACA